MLQSLPVLYVSIDGQPDRTLGAVTDPVLLEELKTDEVLPVGGYVKETPTVRGEDGLLYVVSGGAFAVLEVFDLASYEAADAKRAADIAALPEDLRKLAGLDGWKSEAQKRTERAAERERLKREQAERDAAAIAAAQAADAVERQR